jgi:hypothetical protein
VADYQLVGFDSPFAELGLAVVDWKLAGLEGDELPAGLGDAAAAVGPVVGPQPVKQNRSATYFQEVC